jgi:hypothetical protein
VLLQARLDASLVLLVSLLLLLFLLLFSVAIFSAVSGDFASAGVLAAVEL